MYEKKGIQGRYEEPWLKKVEKMVQAHVEPKLYYACMPESIATYAKKRRLFLPNHLVNRGTVRRTKNYDCYRYSPICREKLDALRCHATQVADVEKFIATEGNPLFDREYFILRMSGKEEVFMGKMMKYQIGCKKICLKLNILLHLSEKKRY